MSQADLFYFRRFKTTVISLALLLVWANRDRLMRLPGLLHGALCYVLCGGRSRQARDPSHGRNRADNGRGGT